MTSAREQTARLADLLRRERAALAEFLVALAEFDRKRLWLDLGHASLFSFLHVELGLSKGAAFYRKTAAELIQRFPEIVEPLRDGRLCFTSIVELSKVITPENRSDLLPRFFTLSKREAKAVSAALLPVEDPPRREVVTAVRVPAVAPAPALCFSPAPVPGPDFVETKTPSVHPENLLRANVSVPDVLPAQLARPSPPQVDVEPLTADLRRLHVTVSRRLLDKLEAARAALSHSHPGAGADEILEAGLDLLLERAAKRKGLVEKPRKEAPPVKSERVPAHVKRAVWTRDGGRCQWPLDAGGICGSTLRVELDHVVPRAQGGPSTVENTRILCKLHNDLAARRAFGDDWMDRFTRKRPDADPVEEAAAPP